MATREEIERQVIETLHSAFAIPLERLVPGALLMQDLDLDSIDAIDLAVQLEDRIGFAPKGPDLRGMRTIQDVVDFLHRCQPNSDCSSVAPPT